MVKNCCLLAIISILFFLHACHEQNITEEHFKSHELSYPLDTSGLTVQSIERAGIKANEMIEPGALEFAESGIQFSKEHFQKQEVKNYIPGSQAIVLNKPVLFRDKTGKVGLMIRATAFGADKPDDNMKLSVEYLGANKKLWKVENFAIFGYDYDFRRWNFTGWVF
jgi:hypothetical protein